MADEALREFSNSDHLSLNDIYDMYGHSSDTKELFYDWMGVNSWLFKQINAIRGDVYDTAMLLITKLGDYHNFPYFMGTLLIFALLWAMARRIVSGAGIRQVLVLWVGVFIVLTAGFFANAVVIKGFMKDYFHYPRPYIALVANKHYGNPKIHMRSSAVQEEVVPFKVNVLERRNAEDDFHSFPSGHAAFITLMVVGLWPVLSANLQWLGVFAIIAVSWSRVSLGVHFPADVLGGFLVTFFMVIIIRAVLYKILFHLFGLKC